MRKMLPAVILVFSVAACGSPARVDDAPEVATLTSPPASSAPAPERPRARLDGSADDLKALAAPFYKCMAAHGGLQGEDQGWVEGDDAPAEIKTAQKACEQLWPLPPWELDAANPEAKDFARDVVKCLKGKGVKNVTTGEDGLGVVAGDGSVSETGEFLDACYREVAARG